MTVESGPLETNLGEDATATGVRCVSRETTCADEGGAVETTEFDDFYAASAPRLVGQLTAMLGSHVEAQDCVQEAFIKAWQHRRELDAMQSPDAWVRRTAWRIGVSRWRQATATLRAHNRRGADADVPAIGDIHTDLMAALRKINPDQRRAIVLHHLCDLSVDEVAVETNSPVGTVKARLARGRAALGSLLGDEAMPGKPANGQEVPRA